MQVVKENMEYFPVMQLQRWTVIQNMPERGIYLILGAWVGLEIVLFFYDKDARSIYVPTLTKVRKKVRCYNHWEKKGFCLKDVLYRRCQQHNDCIDNASGLFWDVEICAFTHIMSTYTIFFFCSETLP